MEGPRRIPIHRALNRPNLFMGGERRLVLTLFIFVGIVLMSNTASLTTWICSAVLAGGALHGLRSMAKRDPRFTEVYLRQLKYQAYYPPKRGVDAPQPRSKVG